MTRHAQLWCSLSIVVVLLLLASCSPSHLEDLKENRIAWAHAFSEWQDLEYAVLQAAETLVARVNASPAGLSYSLVEFEDLVEGYRDGPYKFVLEGGLPQFPEVLEINGRIGALVETSLKSRSLLHEFLANGGADRLEASQALSEQVSRDRLVIVTTALGLKEAWINDQNIPLRESDFVSSAE